MRTSLTKVAEFSKEKMTEILTKRGIPLSDRAPFMLLTCYGKIRDHKGFGTRLCFDKRYISATNAIMRELSKGLEHSFPPKGWKPSKSAA